MPEDPLILDILDYLSRHPEGEDDVVGIVKWWLPEAQIHASVTRVEAALEHLVSEGFVEVRSGPGNTVYYRVTKGRLEALRALLAGRRPPSGGRPG